MSNNENHKILILDFGSQYTQLIARRIREMNVYCEIHHHQMDDVAMKAYQPSGIILSGGPQSVHEIGSAKLNPAVFNLACPILGVCYGMQAMADCLGGQVTRADTHEYGLAYVNIVVDSPLFSGIDGKEAAVWMSHGDQVTQCPDGFSVIACTNDTPIAAFANEATNHYAVQFHPEVTHTVQGMQMLSNFVKTICGCDGDWTPTNIVADIVAEVRAQVGSDTVLLGLSGGVDSSVVAALLHRAIGKQLVCVFVDNGLLRLNERRQVENIFSEHMDIRVIYVDAGMQFLVALQGIDDPEQKRKTIGRVFIDVFEQEAKKLGVIKWLAQGTIYPDVIESAAEKTGTAQVIKSHHNVGGLPERMSMQLVEPLRELFKDEVRQIGVTLGLPKSMVYRHPFPGPGLGIRILGEVKPEYIPILQAADDIYMTELRDNDLYDKTSQAFAVFLPIKSVGVKGDARCYDYVICLRAVVTSDFMTAHVAHLPFDFLERVATRIMNEVPHVSRVTYDISSKPPATIEWE